MKSSRSRRWSTRWAAAIGVGAIAAAVGAVAVDRSQISAHARVADDPAQNDTWIFMPLCLSGRSWAPGPVPTARSSPTQPPAAPSHTPAAPTSTIPPPLVNECAAPDPDWIFCDSFEEAGTWDGSIERPTTVTQPGPTTWTATTPPNSACRPAAAVMGSSSTCQNTTGCTPDGTCSGSRAMTSRRSTTGQVVLAADVSWYLGRSGIRPNGDEYFVSTLEPSTKPPHVM